MDFSANELVRFQKFMDENHEIIKEIMTTPILFVQGCNDRLVKSKSTFELFDDVGVKDKTLLSIPSKAMSAAVPAKAMAATVPIIMGMVIPEVMNVM